MTDYWGAQAYWTSGGPNGEGAWYTAPAQDPNLVLTEPPTSDGASGPTIEQIYQQIENAQPAHLSALADQWQNLYNLLDTIKTQLRAESTALYNEHWKESAARDTFMKWGPGVTLAYLDEWMTSALANQSALRAVVGIVRDFQGQMKTLWSQYQQAVKDAQDVSGWDKFKDWFMDYNLVGGSDQPDYNRDIAAQQLKQTQEAQKKYNQLAQTKAYAMAQQLFDSFTSFYSGHGPVFSPPDAVIDPPGHPPMNFGAPGAPGAPPGGAPGPKLAGPKAAPPAPPPLAPGAPKPANLENFLAKLNALNPPPAPGAGPAAAPAAPPAPPAPPVVPPLPAGAPGALPGGLPGGAPGGLPTGAGGLSQFPTAKMASTNGILQGKGGMPGAPNAPNAGMRSPAAPPAGGRALSRRPPGSPASESEANPNRSSRGVLGRSRGSASDSQPGVEEPFGRSPSGTAPPVLNNKRPNRARPGSPEELSPESGGRSRTPSVGRSGTTPPVLSRPGAGASPEAPGRGKGDKSRDRSKRTGKPGSEWVGTEAAVADAAAPVLDAPTGPPTGAAVSGLEEVPKALRGSTPQQVSSAGARRQPVAPSELSRRTHQPSAGAPVAAGTGAVEEQQIVTDEEAFSVDTPGGGVLGGRQEDTGYRVEPKPQLGG